MPGGLIVHSSSAGIIRIRFNGRTRDFCAESLSARFPGLPVATKINFSLEAISKIVDSVKGQGANRFKHGAYTLVFEYFESVGNTALGR